MAPLPLPKERPPLPSPPLPLVALVAPRPSFCTRASSRFSSRSMANEVSETSVKFTDAEEYVEPDPEKKKKMNRTMTISETDPLAREFWEINPKVGCLRRRSV